MAYEKQGFYSGQKLQASQLDAMEDGIIEAQALAMEGAAGAANMEKGVNEGGTQQNPRMEKMTAPDENGHFYLKFPIDQNPGASISAEQEYGAIGNYSASLCGRSSAQGTHSMAINNSTVATGAESFAQGYASVAAGDSSIAGGSGTYAGGEAAVSLGLRTQALGNYSYAGGARTKANAELSQATGVDTIANGYASSSEGIRSVSDKEAAHAEGINTKANGMAAHAEGINAQALGNYAHAEGNGTKAYGENSHTEGVESTTKLTETATYGEWSFLHAEGGATANPEVRFVTDGTQTVTKDPVTQLYTFAPVSITGFSFSYNSMNGDWLDDSNTDIITSVEDVDGAGCIVQILASDGSYPIIVPTIKNDGAWYDISFDLSTELYGGGTLADYKDMFSGFVFKMGDLCGSVKIKDIKIILSDNSSITLQLEESQVKNIPEWETVVAPVINNFIGNSAHAQGMNTIACGLAAHSQGVRTIAKGDVSHAEGIDTIASGYASHASGINTIANQQGQTVVGKYNKIGRTGSVFVIGGGSSDAIRQNALEVLQDGEIIICWKGIEYSLNAMLQLIANAHNGDSFFDAAKK